MPNWNLILLIKMKLLKFIAAEPPPLTSGTSHSRIAIIGTVVGFLILVVIGLLFGIIIIRRRRIRNGKKTLVAGNGYGGC
jgi:ABC-type nitrate/sulfonate/bicarbonate transport system permease component